MPNHPLAEVFGFPVDNQSPEARRYRELRLCPFHNRSGNCTKVSAKDPLGVCSVLSGNDVAITCPIRFRQDWLILEHAFGFFFPARPKFTSLFEVPLLDRHGRKAGNIDIVLVSYDEQGKITDFGALEVQGVYTSGSIRPAFRHYIKKGIRLRRDRWMSVMYAEGLNSAKSAVTLQSTDRHEILGEKSAYFQVPL